MSGRRSSIGTGMGGRGGAGRAAAVRLVAVMLVAVAACAAPPAPTPSPPSRPSRPSPSSTPLAAAAQRIDALIGEAACRADADCATVGIGWLACGGPQRWQAWSRTATSATALDEAVAAHRALRQKEIERTGEMSVCALVADPGAFCDGAASGAGHCRVRRDGRGGAAAVR
jgi:hypothetical protein